MNHLETLVAEYMEWRGFFVRKNILVGPLPGGGWEGELDIVGYDPKERTVVHYELSLDALSWVKREENVRRKFAMGKKYISTTVFPWLSSSGPEPAQVAVFSGRPRNGLTTIGGGKLVAVDELVRTIRQSVSRNSVFRKAIPEIFPLLRTIQITEAGYKKRLPEHSAANVAHDAESPSSEHRPPDK